jgi:hypothetical protein
MESWPLKEVWRCLRVQGVICCNEIAMGSIKEQVEVDHVTRYFVGPFKYLWSNVDQECIGGPASKDHYFCR